MVEKKEPRKEERIRYAARKGECTGGRGGGIDIASRRSSKARSIAWTRGSASRVGLAAQLGILGILGRWAYRHRHCHACRRPRAFRRDSFGLDPRNRGSGPRGTRCAPGDLQGALRSQSTVPSRAQGGPRERLEVPRGGPSGPRDPPGSQYGRTCETEGATSRPKPSKKHWVLWCFREGG